MDAESPRCERCGDTGWVVEGDEAFHCECYESLRQNILISQANIPDRYAHCTLKEFDRCNNISLSQALDICLGFRSAFPAEKKGLLLMGGHGVGKTHLAVGIIKDLADKDIPCLFVDSRALLQEIKDSYSDVNAGLNETDILGPVLQTDVVVLDDLGAEMTTGWVQDRLGFIINYRYNQKKTMIVTSNFLVEEGKRKSELERKRPTLQDRIGQRSMSRLYEMCTLVEIEADDYREEHADKKSVRDLRASSTDSQVRSKVISKKRQSSPKKAVED